MKKIVILLGLFVSHLVSYSVFASPLPNSLWHDVAGDFLSQPQSQRQLKTLSNDEISQKSLQQPLKRRTLTLNERGLRKVLSTRKPKSRSSKATNFQTEIELPLPNGKFTRLKVFDSPILSPEIAAQYPEIKTWRVQGVDNPVISGRLDFTSKGFHGMLNMPDGDTVYIDPDENNTSGLYHSLSKLENISRFKTEFDCQVHDQHPLFSHSKNKTLAGKKLAQAPALDLITYRLAIAGTAEYTNSQGGTPASAYASMVTTINRVNEIYQRDLGIKLEIVSGNSFAYTNASTDPYTNSNAVAMIDENINNLKNNFGSANYDIGHVFAQGPLGGLAYVGATCYEDYKAGGVTGIVDPQGEVFAVEFVAHEMGHQLGATHTFNSEQRSCGNANRTPETAVEPGSGSTIMSYSGLCGTDDIQDNSDAMFHWVSIDQVNRYTRIEEGLNCGSRGSTGNQNPVADAGADSTIPRGTPFLLEGSATGGETYSWDQIDAGSASPVDTDMADNAIIRVLLPSSNTNRYIPRLSDLFAGTQTIGETLPQTVRDVNFAFVVRDNNGGIDADLKTISVRDTGSIFRVLSQSSAEMLTTGEAVDIAWSTGRTNTAPINCSKVDIQLIREDGVKNMLLSGTDNDGGQTLVVPTTIPVMTNARIMVACSSQPFFQISSGNITVQQGANGGDTTPPVITINGLSTISIVEGENYIDAGATAHDDIDGVVSVTTTGTVNTSVVGTYNITYTASDAAGNTATKTRIVNVTSNSVADTTPPEITINGLSTISIVKDTSYIDAGATAYDDIDGVVSVTTTGAVNTSVVGTYNITYTATDAAGNMATAVRVVHVTSIADTTPPVITLIGASYIEVIRGETYIDAGATATDNVDTIVSVSRTGAVNTGVIGTYQLIYSATDTAGNAANNKTRIVKVISNSVADTTPPVITLQGNSVVTLRIGQAYSEPGFSATDNHDGVVSVIVNGTVDISTIGTYVLTYTASDAAGNTATKTRIVNVTSNSVADTTAPVITLLGHLTVTLTEGDSFTEPGFSALDNIDGTVAVNVTGTVDTKKPGTYVLTYTAVDAAGNSSSLNRTVVILKRNNGGHTGGSSSGGSVGFLLLPFVLIGLRRFLKLRTQD